MLKETFLLSYFCVTKRRVQGGEATSERRRRDGVYQKSASRTRAVLLLNLALSRRRQPTHCVHWLIPAACTSQSRELCVASACGRVAWRKSAVLCSQQFQLYHACEHFTRKNRADSCTHCPPPHTNTGDSVARICIFPCFYFKLSP